MQCCVTALPLCDMKHEYKIAQIQFHYWKYSLVASNKHKLINEVGIVQTGI